MVKSTLCALLVFGMTNGAFAQQSLNANSQPTEKKPVSPPPNSAVGVKKRSSHVKEKAGLRGTTNASVQVDQKPIVARAETAKVSDLIRTDFNNMPADVKARINSNKTTGKELMEGIAKVFTVEIKSINTDAERKSQLSFLSKQKNYIDSRFISPGMVKLIVEPAFESTDLKEIMGAEAIQFNFINRSYILKN